MSQSDKKDENSSWILVYHRFLPSKTTLILHVDMGCSNLTNIIVEKPEKEEETARWMTTLFLYFGDTTMASADAATEIIDNVLDSCRQKYGQGAPLLGNSIYLRDASEQPLVVEAMDRELESLLRTTSQMFGDEQALPPLVSRSNLHHVSVKDGSFMVQTTPVLLDGKVFVAKGPASAVTALDDLSEIGNLIYLPTRHPNIIPPPTRLVTLSDKDKRICGYLTPFYKNGNLDRYSAKIRPEGQLSGRTLQKWYKQLVSAVGSLIDANTYHGDIKPDNILVSDSEDLMLIDFTRTFTTMAIASPEVKEAVHRTRQVRVPPDWPIEKIEKSEVYSIGRTMFLISEGISMSDVYYNRGPQGGKFLTDFPAHSLSPTWLKQIILGSLNEDPLARPTLRELSIQLMAVVS